MRAQNAIMIEQRDFMLALPYSHLMQCVRRTEDRPLREVLRNLRSFWSVADAEQSAIRTYDGRRFPQRKFAADALEARFLPHDSIQVSLHKRLMSST